MNMYLPIAIIVLSNIFYHICSKSVPEEVNPFAAIIVTYFIGAVFSTVLYFLTNKNGNMVAEWKNLNWSSFVLGFAIVGLEAGNILMYKAGWNISVGQLVCSSILTVCLLIVGMIFYHETITISKVVGVFVCLIGLFLINQ